MCACSRLRRLRPIRRGPSEPLAPPSAVSASTLLSLCSCAATSCAMLRLRAMLLAASAPHRQPPHPTGQNDDGGIPSACRDLI